MKARTDNTNLRQAGGTFRYQMVWLFVYCSRRDMVQVLNACLQLPTLYQTREHNRNQSEINDKMVVNLLKSIILCCCYLVVQNISGQQNLPVIKANTKNVRIVDGKNDKRDFWVIFPETKPDIYYLDLPRKEQKLQFITDVDSIAFDMKYGETKDFIVLLNGKDSCYTQISANYPLLKKPKKGKPGNDTIPFTMKDNRIYFKGSMNGSELLNIQFDLGAGAVNINKKSVKKININFDKKGYLTNSDGSNETRVSSANDFEIAGLVWSGIEVYETKNMENYEDVIIGNGFFLDQVYKIDYDKSMLILYDEMPKIKADFVQQDMILDNGVRPALKAFFTVKGSVYGDWFLFDTGNKSNGMVGNRFLENNKLYDKFTTIVGIGSKKIAFIPALTIAHQTFSGGVIALEKPNKNESQYKYGGLIGNKILKRFNVVIDNRQGFIYLKPNYFFEQKDFEIIQISSIVFLVGLGLCFFIFKKRQWISSKF